MDRHWKYLLPRKPLKRLAPNKEFLLPLDKSRGSSKSGLASPDVREQVKAIRVLPVSFFSCGLAA